MVSIKSCRNGIWNSETHAKDILTTTTDIREKKNTDGYDMNLRSQTTLRSIAADRTEVMRRRKMIIPPHQRQSMKKRRIRRQSNSPVTTTVQKAVFAVLCIEYFERLVLCIGSNIRLLSETPFDSQ